jgi:hypothetical protein
LNVAQGSEENWTPYNGPPGRNLRPAEMFLNDEAAVREVNAFPPVLNKEAGAGFGNAASFAGTIVPSTQ